MVFPKGNERILMVGPFPPTVGGISTFIADIIGSDLAQKYVFIPFDTSRPVRKGRILSADGYRDLFCVTPLYLAKALLVTLQHLLLFPIILLTAKPNLVHVNSASYWVFWESSLYVFASKIFRAKVILHIHGGAFDKFYNGENALIKNLVRIVLGFPEQIVALSSYWKNFLRQKVGLRDRVIVINNGVVSSRYMPQRLPQRKNKNEVRVLFVGGMEARRKGIYTLIKSIPFVIKEATNVIFIFIGESELDNVRMLSRNLGIDQYVEILGQVSEKDKVTQFLSSDIFVLPTYSEGLPVALLEAMATGLPVISTPVGAIPEVVEEGKNGFLIQPGDCKALAEKIVKLAKDKKMRQVMGKNNVEKIEEQYDRSIITQRLDNAYRKLIELNN